jgi:hypothetical protein
MLRVDSITLPIRGRSAGGLVGGEALFLQPSDEARVCPLPPQSYSLNSRCERWDARSTGQCLRRSTLAVSSAITYSERVYG